MDYEKAYKAVLKTATQWIKDGCTDKERICLESVFPELAESEDERIRKEIINFLRPPFVTENITDEKIAPWIAYLEKLKEPIDPFDTKLFQDGVKEGRRLEREDMEKEQKPAEWSEEDEKIRRNLMSLLANMRGDRITEETYQKYYPWLKDLRPSWKPSEQEKGALRTAICVLTEERNFPKTAAQLQNILDVFEGEESRKDWKPSEEQIDYLQQAIEEAETEHLYALQRGLVDLMEELKKLF